MHTLACFSRIKVKNTFLSLNEWKAASLFLSKIDSFQKSCDLSTSVSLVYMTQKAMPKSVKQFYFHIIFITTAANH